MEKKCEYVLKLLCDKLSGNPDGYVTSVDIGINLKEDRKEIMQTLENDGYVTNIQYIGHNSVSCYVTDRGRNYFC